MTQPGKRGHRHFDSSFRAAPAHTAPGSVPDNGARSFAHHFRLHAPIGTRLAAAIGKVRMGGEAYGKSDWRNMKRLLSYIFQCQK